MDEMIRANTPQLATGVLALCAYFYVGYRSADVANYHALKCIGM